MATFSGSAAIYHSWLERLGKNADLGSDSFVMLLTSALYVPSASGHSTIADVSNELSGNGYARQNLGSVSYAQVGGTAKFDFADPVFNASGAGWTARWWIIFDDTIAAPADPLVAYGLLNSAGGGTDVTLGAGNTLTFNVNAGGLFTIS